MSVHIPDGIGEGALDEQEPDRPTVAPQRQAEDLGGAVALGAAERGGVGPVHGQEIEGAQPP